MRPIDADALIEFCAERWIPLNIDAVNMQPTIQLEKAQLSQEGTTSVTISRQQAIDALDCISGVEEVLRSLPTIQPEPTDEQVAEYCKRRCLHIVTDDFFHTVQPEPQEGHWIDKGWNGDWAWQIDGRGNCWRVIECSECGKGVSVESNYCPHCGAHMKGAEHETD